MFDNSLLLEKHQVQKKLDQLAEHDLLKYVSNTHTRIEILVVEFGLNLTYGIPSNDVMCLHLPV